MKQINLLPPEAAVKVTHQRTTFFVVVAVIAGVLAILVPWWTLRQFSAGLAVDADARLADVTGSNSQQATSAEISRRLSDLKARTQALNEMAAKEADWNQVFDLVSEKIPQDVTLATFSAAGGTGVVTVKLGGTAPSNTSFVAFMEVLKTQPAFRKIVVDGFTYEPKDGSVIFALTLEVLQGSVSYPKAN